MSESVKNLVSSRPASAQKFVVSTPRSEILANFLASALAGVCATSFQDELDDNRPRLITPFSDEEAVQRAWTRGVLMFEKWEEARKVLKMQKQLPREIYVE